jgi:hypothetical protein
MKQDVETRAPQLLYSRRESARILGVSIQTVIRLEQRGLLTPIRLMGTKTGAVHHAAVQVHALAEPNHG